MIEIYVDSIKGVDSVDSKCYKTLEYCISRLDKTLPQIRINIGEGTYKVDITNIVDFKNLILQGQGINTTVDIGREIYDGSGAMAKPNLFLDFRKFIMTTSLISTANQFLFKFKWHFSNIVFNSKTSCTYSTFCPYEETYTDLVFNNCISVGEPVLLRSTGLSSPNKIRVMNCYGKFKTVYPNTDTSYWKNDTVYLTDLPDVDKYYKILDSIIPINVGVYGGDYPFYTIYNFIEYNGNIYSNSTYKIIDSALFKTFDETFVAVHGLDKLNDLLNTKEILLIKDKFKIITIKK